MTAGDIKEVAVDHPELGSRVFAFKSSEDATRRKGGYVSADNDDGITSTGTMIDVMNMKRWQMELVIGCSDDDYDFVVDLAASPVLGTWTFQNQANKVSTGEGKPVGDIEKNDQAGTMTLKLAGGGKLEYQ